MDGWTKFLIGATAVAVICYATQVYGGCAFDPHCHLRFCGRHACGVVYDRDDAAQAR